MPTAGLSLPSKDWSHGYRRIAVSIPGLSYVDAAEAVEVYPRAGVTEPSLPISKSSRLFTLVMLASLTIIARVSFSLATF